MCDLIRFNAEKNLFALATVMLYGNNLYRRIWKWILMISFYKLLTLKLILSRFPLSLGEEKNNGNKKKRKKIR